MSRWKLALMLSLVQIQLYGQQITWSQDVACIIYSHCTRCHNNTESLAAIPLTNYYEAWSQRNAILYYVDNKLMPPYQPTLLEKNYIHEKRLSQEEIDIVVRWVEQGAPEGDSALAPKAPVIVDPVPQIKFPDFSERITPYKVPDTVGFKFRCFLLPGSFNEKKYISELEILPTDLSAVYSVFLYSDTSNNSLKLDLVDPSNGYESYSGIGSSTAKLLYGWVNGNYLYKPPPGMSLKLDSGSHLVVRILFAEDAMNKMDSTLVNLKFDTTSKTRPIYTASLLHHDKNLLNPPLLIPADSIKTYTEKYTVPQDMSIIGISHWGQKICTSMRCFSVIPNGDTIFLLEIGDHEDLWSQGIYHFEKPVRIPSGSILYGIAEFNNTYWNPNNPFDPPHTIKQGNTDTSEQMIFAFAYLPYQAGDENIIADSIVHQKHYLGCEPRKLNSVKHRTAENGFKIYPNPVDGQLFISSNRPEIFTLSIFNPLGLRVFEKNYATLASIDMRDFPSGIYIIYIKSNNQNITKKIIKK